MRGRQRNKVLFKIKKTNSLRGGLVLMIVAQLLLYSLDATVPRNRDRAISYEIAIIIRNAQIAM